MAPTPTKKINYNNIVTIVRRNEKIFFECFRVITKSEQKQLNKCNIFQNGYNKI